MPAGARFGPVGGLRIRRTSLPASHMTVARRRPCTTGARTALDLARAEPLVEAVVALDVLLARGVVDRSGLRRALNAAPSLRGLRQAGRAVALADPRAESPPESRVRVLLALAGMAAVPRHTVRDAGGTFVARVELAFPEHPSPSSTTEPGTGRRPAGPGPAPAQPPDRHGLAGPVRDGRRPAGPGRAGGPGRRGARPLTGQAPKSCVHHGPPGPSATPTPSVDSEQFRMFARCPGLSIHPAMTAAASRWP